MATKKSVKSVYNVNEMRKAILAARHNGNRNVLTEPFCEKMGISKGFYQEYIGRMNELQIAVSEYIKRKHYTKAQIAQIGSESDWENVCNEAREAIFAKWKNLLEVGEKDKFTKQLHVNPHDIDSLVGYGEMFMNMSNNTDSQEKAIACSTAKKFQKAVETLLGIRIDDVAVLSDEDRDYLLTEKRLSNSIKSTTKAKKDYEDKIKAYNDLIGVLTDADQKAKVTDMVIGLQQDIASCDAKIAKATDQLNALRSERQKALKAASKKTA